MFTGIIQEIGRVRKMGRKGGFLVLETAYDEDRGKLRKGDSMAVNGVCLTATTLGSGTFTADLSGETQKATTLDGLRPGDPVNLERALAASDPMGGHFVLGHVDAVGQVKRVVKTGAGLNINISAPDAVMSLVVEKGSVTVDGISLTVGPVAPGEFSVFIIPETEKSTTIGTLKAGSRVNLEADYLARLVRKFLGKAGGGVRNPTPWAAEE